MTAIPLTDEQSASLAGEAGPAAQLAMRLVLGMAESTGARALIPITRAHVDGCLYHGQVSLDFARALATGGGAVRVPTTLNVGIIDLLHPELFRGDAAVAAAGREMRELYRALGCRETWTCAPYQLADRPDAGEQIAWAESNAIVFANSALGARTERYGDFMDIAAAISGCVPLVGLHTDAGRRATVEVRLRLLPDALRRDDLFAAVLGHVLGRRVGTAIAAITGMESATEDQLKAIGAAGASAGAVAMFHVVGVTPEAATLADATGGTSVTRVIELTRDEFAAAYRELQHGETTALGSVALGTPHFSVAEFGRLHQRLAGRRIADGIDCYVTTGREVLETIDGRGWAADLRAAGVTLVTDTCTYLTPILRKRSGLVMTNSAKWAWYAPGNLGYDVVFATLDDCVESAVAGRVVRDTSPWSV